MSDTATASENNAETAVFQDFSVAERKLWWDVLRRPFDDWQIVSRWVISSAAFAFIQDMSPRDIEAIESVRGTPAVQELLAAKVWRDSGTTPPPDSLQGKAREMEKEDKLTDELKLVVLLLINNMTRDAVAWLWEVASVEGYTSPLDLRRLTSSYLQSEMSAAGDCSSWLSFMCWVVYRRSGGNKMSWGEWAAVTDGQTAADEGASLFAMWYEMRLEKEQALEGKTGDTPEFPLESTEEEPLMSGV